MKRLRSARRLRCLVSILPAYLSLGAAYAVQPTTSPAKWPESQLSSESLLGRYRQTIGELGAPISAAIDDRGRIYVAESEAARISVFDRAGTKLFTIGERGTAAGQFLEPAAIAVTPANEIIVADAGLNRISIFDGDGRHVRTFGSFGTRAGEVISPRGLWAGENRILVADAGNSRLQAFSLDGRPLEEIGAIHRLFWRPTGVARGADGPIFLTDGDLDRVTVFGSQRPSFGVTGPFPGMLLEPAGIAVNDDRVYVAERLNHRIQVFDAAGKPLYQWGLHAYRPREGEGRLHYPSAVAIAPDGSFAVVCEPFEDRVQIFDHMPPGQKPPQNPFIGLDPSGGSHYMSWADVDRRFLVTGELETDKVAIYDASREEPVMVTTIGQRGTAPGQFIRPAGACLDVSRSTLYVSDAGNRRVCVFTLNLPKPGELRFVPDMARLTRLVRFDALRQSDERLAKLPVFEPAAIACSDKKLYVSDLRTGTILVFDEALVLKAVWTDGKAAREGPRCLVDLAVAPKGDMLLAADAAHGRIVGFDSSGEERFAWRLDSAAAQEALLTEQRHAPVRPMGLCVLPDGGVLVSDAANHRVMQLDEDGTVQRSWASKGIGAGELFRPAAICALGEDELIVIDYGNHRGAIFDRAGTFRRAFGSRLFTQPARQKDNRERRRP